MQDPRNKDGDVGLRDAIEKHQQTLLRASQADAHGRYDHRQIADGHMVFAECLVTAGEPSTAAKYFALAHTEHTKGDRDGRIDRRACWRSLQRLAYCLDLEGDHAAAAKYSGLVALEMCQSHEAGRGISSFEEAASQMHRKGEYLVAANQMPNAYECFERAIDLLLLHVGEGNEPPLELAYSLFEAGALLLDDGKPEAALSRLQQGLTIVRWAIDRWTFPHVGFLHKCHAKIGSAWLKLGRWELAFESFEAALGAVDAGDVETEAMAGDRRMELAYRQGLCLQGSKDYEAARKCFDRVLDTYLSSKNGTADAFRAQDAFDKAIECSQALGDWDAVMRYRARANDGVAQLGFNPAERTLIEVAYEVHSARKHGDKQREAIAYVGYAFELLSQGNIGRAREVAREAACLAEEARNPEVMAEVELVESAALFREGRTAEARAVCERVRDFARASDAYFAFGAASLELARLHLRQGNPSGALEALDEADLALDRAPGERADRGHADASLMRAQLFLSVGQAKKAYLELQRAHNTYSVLGSDLGLGNTWMRAGDVLTILSRLDEARDAYERAHALHSREGSIRGLACATIGLHRIAYLRGETGALEALEQELAVVDEPQTTVSLSIEFAQALAASGDHSRALAVLEEAERQARRIQSTLSLVQILTARSDTALSAKQHELAVSSGMSALDLMRELLGRTPTVEMQSDLSERSALALGAAFEGLLADNRVELALNTYEKYRAWTLRAFRDGPDATPTARQEREPGEATDGARKLPLVRHAASDGCVLLLFYTSRRGPIRCLAVSEQLGACLYTLSATRRDIAQQLGRLAKAPAASWAPCLEELGRVLLGECTSAQVVEDATREPPPDLWAYLDRCPGAPLRVVPAGPVQLVPFAALARRVGAERRYLVEDRALIVLPDISIETISKQPATPPLGRALALLNPTLPGTIREVEKVSSIFSKGAVDVFDTERNRLIPAAHLPHRNKVHPSYDLIHLATHAKFDESSPFEAHIQLGAENLTVRDILDLDFSGAVVALTACETAVADQDRQFDSVSLAGACLASGARLVLGSLWSIDDPCTASLVERTYEAVFSDGRPWADALRSAQLGMLRGVAQGQVGTIRGAGPPSKAGETSSPYYWAALQCYARP